MNRTYIGVSTKMYFGQARTLEWLDGIAGEIDARPRLDDLGVVPFVIPSFPLIPAALERLSPHGVMVGAQTVSWGDGALTGEVSAALLAEMGVSLVEIGHAERRAHFGETAAVIARKVDAALAVGMAPLLCVGEPSHGAISAASDYCAEQVRASLGADPSRLESFIIAYEPVWAIGADRPADADHINGVVTSVRSALARDLGVDETGIRIVYGGSAGAGLLGSLPAVDGLFLGRFAHDTTNFARVLDEAAERGE